MVEKEQAWVSSDVQADQEVSGSAGDIHLGREGDVPAGECVDKEEAGNEGGAVL